MSITSLRKCPVAGCKFNTRNVHADYSQIKKHLKYDHDYKEKQQAAHSFGLISLNEKRSPTWLVESLITFSNMGDSS